MYIFSFVRNFFAVDLPFLQVNSEISSKKSANAKIVPRFCALSGEYMLSGGIILQKAPYSHMAQR